MGLMNEADANAKTSKVVIYLIVAAKIIAYMLLMMGFGVFFYFLLDILLRLIPGLEVDGMFFRITNQVSLLMGAFLAAFIIVRYWDSLPLSELGLSFKGRMKDFLWGTIVAFVIYSLGFGVLYLSGAIEVVGMQFPGINLLILWIVMLLVSITEEVALRGFVLGHLLDAGINRFIALFLSAALFSLLHIFNSNFSIMAFTNILLAGLLLGATYIYTRNLWFPIALHLFWNWLQGPVLGFEVSGERFGTTLLSLELPEENIINGGAFGFEGSIVCTVLMIVATWIILKSASKQFACDRYPRSTPEPGHVDE